MSEEKLSSNKLDIEGAQRLGATEEKFKESYKQISEEIGLTNGESEASRFLLSIALSALKRVEGSRLSVLKVKRKKKFRPKCRPRFFFAFLLHSSFSLFLAKKNSSHARILLMQWVDDISESKDKCFWLGHAVSAVFHESTGLNLIAHITIIARIAMTVNALRKQNFTIATNPTRRFHSSIYAIIKIVKASTMRLPHG